MDEGGAQDASGRGGSAPWRARTSVRFCTRRPHWAGPVETSRAAGEAERGGVPG